MYTPKQTSAFLAPLLTAPTVHVCGQVGSILDTVSLTLERATALETLRLGLPIEIHAPPQPVNAGDGSSFGVDPSDMLRATYPVALPDVLDPETLTELSRWAREHGPEWPARLRAAWFRASAPPALHALRNTHGPEWLARVEALRARLAR